MKMIIRLLLPLCLGLLLAACAAKPFVPCRVEVLSIRPEGDALARLPAALLEQFSGGGEGAAPSPEFVVRLKVLNPNDRGVEVRGLEGVVDGPEGEVGAFRLQEGGTALPARGSAVVEVLAAPGPRFLRNAFAVLLSPDARAQLTASGHVDVSTWLGVRRVRFKKVHLAGSAGH